MSDPSPRHSAFPPTPRNGASRALRNGLDGVDRATVDRTLVEIERQLAETQERIANAQEALHQARWLEAWAGAQVLRYAGRGDTARTEEWRGKEAWARHEIALLLDTATPLDDRAPDRRPEGIPGLRLKAYECRLALDELRRTIARLGALNY